MWFVLLGVLLIALKMAEIGFVSVWSWWTVLSPFAAAAVWWAYADASGLTKRREMNKLENRKQERRRKSMEALGISRAQQKTDDAARRARRALAQRIESPREEKRAHNEQVIRDSVMDSHVSQMPDEPPAQKPKS